MMSKKEQFFPFCGPAPGEKRVDLTQSKFGMGLLHRTWLSNCHMVTVFFSYTDNNICMIDDDHKWICRQSYSFPLPTYYQNKLVV
jgi:hypothetical protein